MSRFQRTRTNANNNFDDVDLSESDKSVGLSTGKDRQTRNLQTSPKVVSSDFAMPDESELKELQRVLESLQQKRMRREIDRDNAQKEIKECEIAAKKLGISNLEELEGYVLKLEEEDKKAMEEFLSFLEEEEQTLNEIERKLADLGRDE